MSRSDRVLRWPQMTVACPWCHAQPGDLCTNRRANRERRNDTHDERRTAWVIAHTACSDCAAPVGSPCRAASTGLTLTGVHPARDAEAIRTQRPAAIPRVDLLGDQLAIPAQPQPTKES